MPEAPRSVLCLCTGNTCRSPMLAALLDAACRARGLTVSVASAGIAAGSGQRAAAHARELMREQGLDIEAHRSRQADRAMLEAADRILCLGPNHALAVIDLGLPGDRIEVVRADHGGVPDPFGGDLDTYRACAEVLAAAAEDYARRWQEGAG